MKTKEETDKNYEPEEPETMKVSEPSVVYGSGFVLNLGIYISEN